MGLSEIVPGPTITATQPGITPLIEGAYGPRIIGSIHTHPHGLRRPSGDRGDAGHYAEIQRIMSSNGRNGDAAMLYIVASSRIGAGQTPYPAIYVYNKNLVEAALNDFTEGPEVNPEAEPCS